MNIAIVHNYYQRPGGEDQVVAAEGNLLEERGHIVTRYTASNDAIPSMRRIALARATVWNGEEYEKLRMLFRTVRPDLVHVHNTFPLISPAVYYAARAEGVAVVQTLHNYRLSCVNGYFFRDGRACEDCLGQNVPWQGVLRGCYRSSRSASAAVATMVGYHKLRGTYRDQVDVYVALTHFAKNKFVAAGLPADKLVVKPNFVDEDPGFGHGQGGYALFVGRLSGEKGIDTMLAAWQHIGSRLPLLVAGNGPVEGAVADAEAAGRVTWLGQLPRNRVLELLRGAYVLVFPSKWFEGFPMSPVEALATGTPVIGSDIGSVPELVEHGRTGLLIAPGDSDALVNAVGWVLDHPERVAAMRIAARAEYEAKYTAGANYNQLLAIYEQAMSRQ